MRSPRRSKRKCISNYASPDVPPRIKIKNTLQDLKSIGHIRALPNVSLSQKLLELIFDRMNPHIWFRILPLDSNKCDDFAFSVGQSWDLIQPLLLHLGYILEIGEQTKLNVDKLRNLEHANMGKHKFHMSFTHLKGESKHYFICIGKPNFSGPTKQLKAISGGAFASTRIRYLNASDTILRMKLQEHIDVVANDNFRRLSNRDPDRINTLGNTQNLLASAEATIQLQPPLSTKISDSIDRALALDLRIFPRPDRNDNTKTITLKQTNISNQCTKLIVLVTAISWGLHHYSLTYKNRMRVARAASRMVAYDNGYLSEFYGLFYSLLG